MDAATQALKEVFGFDGFRPGQADIVSALMSGGDVFAVMPTGGGKSLCYQLPSIARPGLTVVISPLVALMRDQVAALQSAGVAAAALSSGNTDEENWQARQALEEGALKLIYLAPERLGSASGLLRRAGVTMIAVDEAHCVSQWGHDFRPDYLRISELRDSLGEGGDQPVQMAAFTATADPATQQEIIDRLFKGEPKTFIQGFDRPNLSLAFEPKNQPRDQLLKFIKERKGLSGIVYAGTRSKTEVLAKALNDQGIPAIAYHAGLDPHLRRELQDRFQREDGLVTCGTIAFGMGIDKPDIRFVVHADLPKTIEGYYQEIGRAGRDGAPADTLTLYGIDDIKLRRMQIDEGAGSAEHKRFEHQRFNALMALAEAPTCRRQALLRYFGEVLPEPCGNCDICLNPPQMIDGTEVAQKALSAMYRTDQRFGVEYLIKILLGDADERIRSNKHDELQVFGLGTELTKDQWRQVFRQLLALGFARISRERQGGWMIEDAARPVLRGEQSVQFRADAMAKRKTSSTGRGSAKALLDEDDEPLLSALKVVRRRLAEAQNVPAYVIFADRTLLDMVRIKPQTLDDLTLCHGVGAKKLERYGAEFLAALKGDEIAVQEHPRRIKAAAAGEGALFDALMDAQRELQYGDDGTGKPMTCTQAVIARIIQRRPDSLEALAAVSGVGEAKADRFGDRFLTILREYL
ncbi:MAG: DNA helicase RecQ [Alphaproteobacteria bacterium]|nr:DNA helicase RecQ [Alphaproteobacteria bacterium SS10]